MMSGMAHAQSVHLHDRLAVGEDELARGELLVAKVSAKLGIRASGPQTATWGKDLDHLVAAR